MSALPAWRLTKMKGMSKLNFIILVWGEGVYLYIFPTAHRPKILKYHRPMTNENDSPPKEIKLPPPPYPMKTHRPKASSLGRKSIVI